MDDVVLLKVRENGDQFTDEVSDFGFGDEASVFDDIAESLEFRNEYASATVLHDHKDLIFSLELAIEPHYTFVPKGRHDLNLVVYLSRYRATFSRFRDRSLRLLKILTAKRWS